MTRPLRHASAVPYVIRAQSEETGGEMSNGLGITSLSVASQHYLVDWWGNERGEDVGVLQCVDLAYAQHGMQVMRTSTTEETTEARIAGYGTMQSPSST